VSGADRPNPKLEAARAWHKAAVTDRSCFLDDVPGSSGLKPLVAEPGDVDFGLSAVDEDKSGITRSPPSRTKQAS
jgi:hypothetical protein